MKILVTGGVGFVGSHLVDELVKKKHEVVIYDNLESQVHDGVPEYLNKAAEFLFRDVRDTAGLTEAVNNADVIFHEAALVGVGQSMYDIKRYLDINVMGTANLLEILANKNHSVKKLVVASSMSIYGEGAYQCDNCGDVHPTLRTNEQLSSNQWEVSCPKCGKKSVKPIPTNEEKPLQPTSVYAVSKRDQEELCLSVGKAYGIPTVALRYFNIYGTRQALSNPYTGVCAIFSSRIKNDRPPIVFEDGYQTRDFVSVHDIVQANLLVMKKSAADYDVFNVGTGVGVSILKIAHTLSKLYGTSDSVEVVNKFRAGDIRHCVADISKIQMLGYEPSIGFECGMKELVDWGETQSADDKSAKAFQELNDKGLVI